MVAYEDISLAVPVWQECFKLHLFSMLYLVTVSNGGKRFQCFNLIDTPTLEPFGEGWPACAYKLEQEEDLGRASEMHMLSPL